MAAFWWDKDPAEVYWIEIRYRVGLGTSLQCPLTDQSENTNPWYNLVGQVKPGDVVFHWHAKQSAFVGKSVVAAAPEIRAGNRFVALRDFAPLDVQISLQDLRALQSAFENGIMYLPNPTTSDPYRHMK